MVVGECEGYSIVVSYEGFILDYAQSNLNLKSITNHGEELSES
jgi:hypothetical protein